MVSANDELRDGAVDVVGDRKEAAVCPEVPYEKTYANWLENLRD